MVGAEDLLVIEPVRDAVRDTVRHSIPRQLPHTIAQLVDVIDVVLIDE